MRCKFAGLAVRPRVVRSPGEFIVRINLTFNFPRRASAILRDALEVKRCASELFAERFRRRQFVCRAISSCRITGIIGWN